MDAAGEMRKRSIDRDESQFPHSARLSVRPDRVSTNVIFPVVRQSRDGVGTVPIAIVIITSFMRGNICCLDRPTVS